MLVHTLPCGTKIVGHEGGITGYLSVMLSTPDAKKRLEMSENSSPVEGDPADAYVKILTAVFC